nr:Zinc finger, RING-type [Ipomoea batatas]GMD13139.1 Zinc finger, RING-type [Ipomoea batatas]GMD26007.1 Zinc finger, RING-type [Ipomoea batatas]
MGERSGVGVTLMACFVQFVWRLGLTVVTIKSVVFLVGTYMVCLVSRNGYNREKVPESVLNAIKNVQ